MPGTLRSASCNVVAPCAWMTDCGTVLMNWGMSRIGVSVRVGLTVVSVRYESPRTRTSGSVCSDCACAWAHSGAAVEKASNIAAASGRRLKRSIFHPLLVAQPQDCALAALGVAGCVCLQTIIVLVIVRKPRGGQFRPVEFPARILERRKPMLIRCLLAAVAALLPHLAAAQPWPSKPLRYIVPFAPGGTTDILGRMVAAGLSASLGQPVVVENKPGQAGSIGAAELARSAPDGYTIGGGTISSHAINVTLYPALPYDPLKDFAPITMLATLPNMLIVHPSVKAENVRELIALLKANPNKYSFGSAGNGTSQHISGELFKIMSGTDMQHIPYKGSGPMIPDLIAGTIQLSFENITTAYPQVKGGKLKALAVTSAKRSFVAPDVPTMAEAGLPGYDISSWQAMYAPAGTPREIVTRVHAETVKVLRVPENQKKLQELGLEAGGMSPEELLALMRSDIPRLGKVVRESGAKVD